jgi:hypothetical protein
LAGTTIVIFEYGTSFPANWAKQVHLNIPTNRNGTLS